MFALQKYLLRIFRDQELFAAYRGPATPRLFVGVDLLLAVNGPGTWWSKGLFGSRHLDFTIWKQVCNKPSSLEKRGKIFIQTIYLQQGIIILEQCTFYLKIINRKKACWFLSNLYKMGPIFVTHRWYIFMQICKHLTTYACTKFHKQNMRDIQQWVLNKWIGWYCNEN